MSAKNSKITLSIIILSFLTLLIIFGLSIIHITSKSTPSVTPSKSTKSLTSNSVDEKAKKQVDAMPNDSRDMVDEVLTEQNSNISEKQAEQSLNKIPKSTWQKHADRASEELHQKFNAGELNQQKQSNSNQAHLIKPEMENEGFTDNQIKKSLKKLMENHEIGNNLAFVDD